MSLSYKTWGLLLICTTIAVFASIFIVPSPGPGSGPKEFAHTFGYVYPRILISSVLAFFSAGVFAGGLSRHGRHRVSCLLWTLAGVVLFPALFLIVLYIRIIFLEQ